ncbi:dynamin family protein [Halobacillus campisalis]|uniref:Dynamin family protein n=1 Tax=Halobacillus campisalis TaxID=435909 RepID=A0ABW2K370_9BACI|nr:dynamin family protein [Halobacillus campisalis]
MSVSTKESHSAVLAQIAALHGEVDKHNPSLAEKLLEIIEKLKNEEVMIGFAGHFSAGKSTMINHLSEFEILPSSPIPTSANIVKLFSGDPSTTVHYTKADPEKFIGDIGLETIKKLCKDGEAIEAIEISRPLPGIPSHVKLLDTPGVDSTNDADRLITESSLHLMDFMYYVMDYNHVQSEVNLNFLLEMQKRQTPFSIIINQVDKHNEDELTFDDFKQSVHESLSLWGIEPESIYYTSLKDIEHQYSNLDILKEDFQHKFSKQPIKEQALLHAEAIIHESQQYIAGRYSTELEDLENRLEEVDLTIQKEEERLQGSDYTVVTEEDRVSAAKKQFQDRIKKFITNAYLMPSNVRERARTYLESQQSGFKAGLLFAKKKTEEEKKVRHDKFIEELQETIEKNLLWPLRERLTSFLDAQEITDSSLLKQAQKLNIHYPAARVEELIEPGAEVTGEYVLRYTDQLSKDIQKHFTSEMNEWWEEIEGVLKKLAYEEYNVHRTLLESKEEKQEILEKVEKIESKTDQFKEMLNETLYQSQPSKKEVDNLLVTIEKKNEKIAEKQPAELELAEANSAAITKEEEGSPSSQAGSSPKEEISPSIDRAVETIQDVPGLEGLRTQLIDKKERLLHREYTIALFGAFSAGKSSFANAVLGDRVLPVSPHPTTAAINKIVPPTEKHPHRTVVVKVKSEEELLEDVTHASEQSLPSTLDDAYERVAAFDEKFLNQLDHKKRAFLQAFIAGYPRMKGDKGERMTIAWEDLSSYVSDEKISCFIEWAEIYYDCEWTRKGISLVDTPGADSVNARHTNVSFEYIKNADAILFVTYYNHPFSKADQSFLTQLGRVKDAFSMDKMFFIINAADLADSEEEKQLVEEYLQGQLQQFKIRNPRIFSLSSLEGLKEKQKEVNPVHSGLEHFETRFNRFLEEELSEMLYYSIHHDIEEAERTLESFIRNASLDEQQKDEQLNQLKEEKQRSINVLPCRVTEREHEALQQKINKQLHYVHERLMLNFNDYFKNHINPAVVKGDKAEARERLRFASKELLAEVEYEMNQEIRAVAIRMESFAKERIDQMKKELTSQLKLIKPSIELQPFEFGRTEAITINQTISISYEQFAKPAKLFKGTQSFFENNEKEKVKDQMADLMSQPLREAINDKNHLLVNHFAELMNIKAQEAFDQWSNEIEAAFDRQMYSLENKVDITDLKRRHETIKSLV